jgi:hypothetical protein
MTEPASNEIDPADVVDAAFEPSDNALRAAARRELVRAGIREPNAAQWKAATASARILYIASAKAAVAR